MHDLLVADLAADLPRPVRLQRLVGAVREHFGCGAVGLLKLEGDSLRPVAFDGLVRDALGRRFVVAQHPRLAAILSRREPTWFDPGSDLPDPYDGLLEPPGADRARTRSPDPPEPVHDCMGVSLRVEGAPWGVLTLDALRAGTFGDDARDELERCAPAIEAAIRVTRLEEEVRGLRLSRGAPGPAAESLRDEDDIVGTSSAITALLREVDVVSDSELPVLLLGETGVGKELFARRIHARSRRRDRPLVHVNCAALPESLAESELFGHARGAFSGAGNERPGRFEAADGGTLFLDEVGELPLPVQAKLLRALQNGEIQRLGADQPRQVDVRVVAATNRNLRDGVRDGRFRADLYHRLSVYPVPIPPLRERGADVLLLAGRFLELNRARLGLRSLRLSPAAGDALLRYGWPGNVRELEHVISRAALKAICRGAERGDIVTLDVALLDLDLGASGPDAPDPGDGPCAVEGADVGPLREAVEACQRQAIRGALDACGGNWTRAARRLDLDPSNLHKLARRLGLKS